MNRYHIQAVEEVLAEASFGNLLLEVFVGGSEYAHIHLDGFVATYSGDFVLLQCTQHFRLCRETHVTYLIEEECTAIGLLKLTCTIFDGASEATLGVSKEFALNEFARYSCTVNLHHRFLGACTILVDEVSDYLFTRTVATSDHHSRFGRCYFFDYLAHALDGNTLAYHLIAGTYLLAQHLGLLYERLMLECALGGY